MAPRKTNKDFDKFIGEKIRQRRIILGMSMKELASYIGVGYQQVQKYEKGVNRISATTLYLIATALNVKIQRFVEGFGDSSDHTDSLHEELPATNIQEEKKIRDLLATYYGIPDPCVRKKLLELIKTISRFQ